MPPELLDTLEGEEGVESLTQELSHHAVALLKDRVPLDLQVTMGGIYVFAVPELSESRSSNQSGSIVLCWPRLRGESLHVALQRRTKPVLLLTPRATSDVPLFSRLPYVTALAQACDALVCACVVVCGQESARVKSSVGPENVCQCMRAPLSRRD